ncbi:unnamed protein product [Ranitomeya imitator]|uniref:Uncharacterized protein n=1 Tax=Ranitomeya imitator TaxID=111125 RepID=A0ABN9LNP9_9NEOB|nr:unnamed protein product [Ranitomeya imitator]
MEGTHKAEEGYKKIAKSFQVALSSVRNRETALKPGIAPKIEFSTTTTIKETANGSRKRCDTQSRRSLQNSHNRRTKSPSKSYSCPEKSYNSPTRSSQSRSPSPYTRRRMCELNKDNQQRLAQLHLGNYEFKSDAETRPPFIVRHINHSKPVGEKTSSQLQSPKSKRHSNSKNSLIRPLTFDDLHCDASVGKDCLNIDDLNTESSLDAQFTSGAHSLEDLRTSPVLRGSLRERLRSENNTWESIHNRVRNLLSTHSAKQRLSLHRSRRLKRRKNRYLILPQQRPMEHILNSKRCREIQTKRHRVKNFQDPIGTDGPMNRGLNLGEETFIGTKREDNHTKSPTRSRGPTRRRRLANC